MVQTLDMEKIAEKIQKLLALSESPNEAEAAQAANKAQELLTRHNLSISDLVDNDPQQVLEETIDEAQRISTWKSHLLYAVAIANYSLAFHRKMSHGITKTILLGRPVNTHLTRIQYDYLIQAIERLTKLSKGDRAFKNAFKLGAAMRIASRIRENMEHQKQVGIAASGDSAAVCAIVVRNLYEKLEAEIQAYAKQNLRIKHNQYTPSISSQSGYTAGQAAGDKVSLNKQINPNTGKYLPG